MFKSMSDQNYDTFEQVISNKLRELKDQAKDKNEQTLIDILERYEPESQSDLQSIKKELNDHDYWIETDIPRHSIKELDKQTLKPALNIQDIKIKIIKNGMIIVEA